MKDTERRRRLTRRSFLGAAAAGTAATTVLRERGGEAPPLPGSDADRLIRLVERYGSELGRIRKVG